MKKLITSTLTLFLVFGLSSQTNVNNTIATPAPMSENELLNAEGVQPSASGSSFGEACFFSETFSNGFDGDNGVGPFTFTDSGGQNDPIWEVADANSPCGEFSQDPSFPLQSSTSSNGWVIFDAGCWNTPISNGVFGVQGFLMTPSIDMSDRDEVIVEWEHNFRYCCFDPSPLRLGVSIDGGSNWTYFSAHHDSLADPNSFSGNIIASVDVSSAAANEPEVIISWAYNPGFSSGYSHYFWQIDDICISTPEIPGCTDASACNFNELATLDDGSCLLALGCDECDGEGGLIDNPETGEACDDGDCLTVNDMIADDCICAGTILVDEACFFSETFSNGFDGDNGVGPFTTTDSGGNDPIWRVADENSPCGEFSDPETQALQSTSSCNGWVIFDADCWNTPINDGVFDVQGFMMSPSIDMSERNQVIVSWEHNFRYCCFGISPLNLGVSVDGGSTWTEFSAHNSSFEDANAFSGNITTSVDVSSVAANEAEVIIRWAYNAGFNSGYSHYFWQIDDICISDEYDCPDIGLSIGMDCDDGDESTENDIVDENCVCVGTPNVIDTENDLCQNAIAIGCNGTVIGTTDLATSDDVPNCAISSNSEQGVWFSYTGTGDVVTASLCESAFDTQIAIYEGGCENLDCVTGNDDFCGSRSSVTFNSLQGVEYLIYVTGFFTESGNYELTLTCESPDCETMMFNSTVQGWQQTEIEVTPDNGGMFEPLETTETIVPVTGANAGDEVYGTFIDPRYFVGLNGHFFADFSGPGYNANVNWSDWGTYISLLPPSTTTNVYGLSGAGDENVLAFRWIGYIDVNGNSDYDSGIDIYLSSLDQSDPIPVVEEAGRLLVAFADRRGQYTDNLGELLLTYCPDGGSEQGMAEEGQADESLFKDLSTGQVLTISPNPSDDEFMILSELEMNSIQIMDIEGRTVSVEAINKSMTKLVSLGDMMDGVYLVRITYVDGTVSTDRLILQR